MDERIDTLTVAQLGKLLQVGTNKAQEIMRAIKSVSDTMPVSGICHKQDYEYWKSIRLGKSGGNKVRADS